MVKFVTACTWGLAVLTLLQLVFHSLLGSEEETTRSQPASISSNSWIRRSSSLRHELQPQLQPLQISVSAAATTSRRREPPPITDHENNLRPAVVQQPDSLSGTSTPSIRQHLSASISGNKTATLATADPVVVEWKSMSRLHKFMKRIWSGNLLCDIVQNVTAATPSTQQPPQVTLRFTLNCQEVFEKSHLGSGNILTALYALRLAARRLSVNLDLRCSDAASTASSLVLPWFMGRFNVTVDDAHYQSLSNRNHTSMVDNLTVEEACSSFFEAPLTYLLDEIEYDLRRMAIALVGVPNNDEHPARAWAEEHLWSDHGRRNHDKNHFLFQPQLPTPRRGDLPILPDIELDQAALHFRCGDLMNSKHAAFGFMKFAAFTRHLPADIRLIGILTQNFEQTDSFQTRNMDKSRSSRRCRTVVHGFVKYLQEQFPNATVSIRNGPNETIALAYARMVLADYVVSPISTFSVWPAVATFGRGIIRRPDYHACPTNWLVSPTGPSIESLTNDRIRLVDEPVRLLPSEAAMLFAAQQDDLVLRWFREERWCFDLYHQTCNQTCPHCRVARLEIQDDHSAVISMPKE